MKYFIIFIALLQWGCESDDDVFKPVDPTQEQCNCNKGYYFVAGPNKGQLAKPNPTFYSNNCLDDGTVFPEDNLIWTQRLMIKCTSSN